MTYRERTLSCPRCHRELAEQRSGAHAFCLCAGCGGMFVEALTLVALYAEASGSERQMPELLEHAAGDPPQTCPACDEPMERVWLALIAIDRCSHHGLWLERGHLDRIRAHAVTPPVKLTGTRDTDDVRQLEALGFVVIKPPSKQKR